MKLDRNRKRKAVEGKRERERKEGDNRERRGEKNKRGVKIKNLYQLVETLELDRKGKANGGEGREDRRKQGRQG